MDSGRGYDTEATRLVAFRVRLPRSSSPVLPTLSRPAIRFRLVCCCVPLPVLVPVLVLMLYVQAVHRRGYHPPLPPE